MRLLQRAAKPRTTASGGCAVDWFAILFQPDRYTPQDIHTHQLINSAPH